MVIVSDHECIKLTFPLMKGKLKSTFYEFFFAYTIILGQFIIII